MTALDQAITASDSLTGASEDLSGLIETNASIQPGDSGGSLVDTSGRVVGMDTAASQGYSLSSRTDQGYAIPIAEALSIARQIESGTGSSTVHVGPTAELGVYVSTQASSSSPYGYPFGSQGGSMASGAVVSGVVGGGAAATAGLAQGDRITSLGGQAVSSASDLSTLVRQYRPGDTVQIGWIDSSGATHTATVALGSGPAR